MKRSRVTEEQVNIAIVIDGRPSTTSGMKRLRIDAMIRKSPG